MKIPFVYRVLVYFLLCGIIAAIVLPHSSGSRKPRIPMARREMSNLVAAFNQYYAAYGAYLQGTNSTVLKILLGDNPRKIQLFNADPRRIDSKGEFLDPWKTPYDIQISDQTNYIIRSAGASRVFGDKYDIIFDGSKNDFVVVANGQEISATFPCSLEEFLLAQKLLPRSVVVEHNGEAVAPSEFFKRQLAVGDKLEIVKIVAGG